MRTAHPSLKPLLEKHGLTLDQFWKAMWNPASRENSRENARRTGHTWKGKKRPGQLARQWKAGTFDFHYGRVRSETEKANHKASYTWAVRAKMSTKRISYFRRHPEKIMGWGKREWLDVTKDTRSPKICVRSSYEKKAVQILEGADWVANYIYEPVLNIRGRRRILPDFVVTRADGSRCLVEVKPQWVLDFFEPGSGIVQRLERAKAEATVRGWDFEIWTEKELGI